MPGRGKIIYVVRAVEKNYTHTYGDFVRYAYDTQHRKTPLGKRVTPGFHGLRIRPGGTKNNVLCIGQHGLYNSDVYESSSRERWDHRNFDEAGQMTEWENWPVWHYRYYDYQNGNWTKMTGLKNDKVLQITKRTYTWW